MKTTTLFTRIFISAILILLLGVDLGFAQQPGNPEGVSALQGLVGTAFTYQGQLKKAGAPVNLACDFQFRLWNQALSGGTVGPLQDKPGVSVTGGLFSVALDFGSDAFNGEARWLGILVKCPPDSSYTDLDRQELTPAPLALALPGLWTQQNPTSPNLIGGNSGNWVTPGVYGATISGGGYSGNLNRVTDIYGVVGGGAANQAGNANANLTDGVFATVGGGADNQASGYVATISGGSGNRASEGYATIGGGTGNQASGYRATIGGGGDNWASGYNATIGGGISNHASGDNATVPGGAFASATHLGELAYASGNFDAAYSPGYAQTSQYVLRIVTTDANPVSMFLDGEDATQRLTIADSRTLTFDILVVALSSDGDSAGYRMSGVIAHPGGGKLTHIVGASGLILGEDPGAVPWNAVAAADDVNDALDIRVNGSIGATVRWVAFVRTVEVAW